MLGLKQRDDIRKLYKEWSYNDTNGTGLSRYALKNIAEFIAEGWAEYLNYPTPRPLAANSDELLTNNTGGNTMIDLDNLPDPPEPPIPDSYYASEKETEKYERAIEKIMKDKNIDRRAAQIIFHT